MKQDSHSQTTWSIILNHYVHSKFLRPQTIKNYTRYIDTFTRFFGEAFTHVDALTKAQVASFRYFFN